MKRLGNQILIFVCVFVCVERIVAQDASRAAGPLQVEEAALGKTANVHRVGALYLSGQFEPSDIAELKSAKIARVITLRKPEEIKWDEKREVEAAGMEWKELPFRDPAELTDALFDECRRLLANASEKKTLLHCASANRVGGVWLAHRVLDQSVDWETALAEAKTIGLKNEGLIARAKEYIERQKALPAVGPELNKDFLDPNLDVDLWISRFEVESREIFASRLEILKNCGVQAGQQVADIGAGTGLFTRLFAHEAGDNGVVYAVDIAPAFLGHINKMTRELHIENVSPVLCREDSVCLPPGSIDIAFVCDTYHHLAYPQDTLRTIRKALRPNGTLVVVDFEKIPGTSREWVLGHVRADKQTVRSEIEAAGFEFLDEPDVAGLEENYLMRFKSTERAK
jgi:SAM-dependent methyltransferase/protein tyrosine phosphatase (PTP) superfamily phosphohydrolase (DUF442 family)